MNVAEALLQPHDEFAIGGETEMTGLDDAGVHGPHGNLVPALALDGQELVGRIRPRIGLPRRGDGPDAVIDPVAIVGHAEGLARAEVAQGSLGPRGGKMPARHRGIFARCGRERHDGAQARARIEQQHRDIARVMPDGAKIVQTRGAAHRETRPGRFIHAKTREAIAASWRALQQVDQRQRAHRKTSAACRSQSAKSVGSKRPAASTSAR